MLFNELDPFNCNWLANLFPSATIDRRSIADLSPADLAGHGRVHLFAGVGGWELALQIAGWPPNRPVWTGSCPCQPFSVAGKKKGIDGKSRRIERGLSPLVNGLPRDMGRRLAGLGGFPGNAISRRKALRAARRNRVGRIRGYGNAIVPQVAACFVQAFLEST